MQYNQLRGRIWTGENHNPWKNALMFDAAAGLILDPKDVGPADELSIRIITVPEGSLIIPAFHDCHNHWAHAVFATAKDLGSAFDVQDAVQRLIDHSEQIKNGWIIAYNWDTALIPVEQLNSGVLELVSRKRPVVVFERSRHAAVINQTAKDALLETMLADPTLVGTINNGLLTADYARMLFGLMELGTDAVSLALQRMQYEMHRAGTVSFDDMDLSACGHQLCEIVTTLYREGELVMPCRAYVTSRSMDRGVRPTRCRAGDFSVVGLVEYADGAIGSWTAAMHNSYLDAHGNGNRLLNNLAFMHRVERAISAGLDCFAIHAVGDQGIDDAMEAMRIIKNKLEERNLGSGVHQTRIEHFELPTLDALARCREMQTAVILQPNSVMDAVRYAERLGIKRHGVCPQRKVLNSAIPMAFGTNGMPHDPLQSIAQAVLRADNQAMTVTEAVRAFTTRAHIISGDDEVRGALTPGMEANFIVLDRDIFADPDSLLEAKVTSTWFRGQQLWDELEEDSDEL